MNSHNLYFHVPFCASKCRYCSFFSVACVTPDWDNYKNQILSQIKFWSEKLGKISVPTIFFGGGTPSLMPPSVFAEIISAVHESFDVANDAEITIEANPGTIDASRLSEFVDIGVNRLSVGVQSLNDDILKFLGRVHSADDARSLIIAGLKMGLRVSADFIYAIPGQTIQDVKDLCSEINKLGISHVSLYELSIEPGTAFYGQIEPVSDEIGSAMFDAIDNNLSLQRYEVSNYAAFGQECRHNQNVWDGEPYIGFGPGASGRVLIDKFWYEQGYTQNGEEIFIKLDPRARAMEKLITGLRQVRGVKFDEVSKIIDTDFLNLAINDGKLEISEDRLRATKSGLVILDNLLLKLLK